MKAVELLECAVRQAKSRVQVREHQGDDGVGAGDVAPEQGPAVFLLQEIGRYDGLADTEYVVLGNLRRTVSTLLYQDQAMLLIA